MARKWQKVASFGRRSDLDSCSTSAVADKGHFVVYSSEGIRFVVPLAYLGSNVFKELFKMSEEEYGLPSDGPIVLPCDAACMEYVLCLLRRRVSEDVQKALLSSISASRRPRNSCIDVGHAHQLPVSSFGDFSEIHV